MKTPLLFTCLMLVAMTLAGFASSRSNPLNSIKPFQYKHKQTGALVTFCTAWSTYLNGFQRWITAYHCVADEMTMEIDTSFEYYVDGVRVYLHSGNQALDLVALEGGPTAPGLKVARKMPESITDKGELAPIWGVGFPHGIRHVVSGTIAGEFDIFSIFQLPVMGGMSGGPVLSGASVIGVIQQSACNPAVFCPVGISARLDKLRLFLFSE